MQIARSPVFNFSVLPRTHNMRYMHVFPSYISRAASLVRFSSDCNNVFHIANKDFIIVVHHTKMLHILYVYNNHHHHHRNVMSYLFPFGNLNAYISKHIYHLHNVTDNRVYFEPKYIQRILSCVHALKHIFSYHVGLWRKMIFEFFNSK